MSCTFTKFGHSSWLQSSASSIFQVWNKVAGNSDLGCRVLRWERKLPWNSFPQKDIRTKGHFNHFNHQNLGIDLTRNWVASKMWYAGMPHSNMANMANMAMLIIHLVFFWTPRGTMASTNCGWSNLKASLHCWGSPFVELRIASFFVFFFKRFGPPVVTIGFNTKVWSSRLDDLGVPPMT